MQNGGQRKQDAEAGANSFRALNRLDLARVEHDAETLANGGRREILAELGADDAIVAVRGDDATPHEAILRHLSLGVLLGLGGLVNVSDALAQVELGVLAVFHTLNLDARLLHVLVAAIALVADVHRL